ncbi:MAG TPA: carotenoid biosynthesis protein [Pyrinomonadaceae bacterium]
MREISDNTSGDDERADTTRAGTTRNERTNTTHDKRANTLLDERASATRDERVNRTHDESMNGTRDESMNGTRANTARVGHSWRGIALAVLASAYVVLWAGGVGHYLFVGAVAAEQQWLASAFLGVAGLIVLLAAGSRGAVLRLVAVAALGLVFELSGVRYGLPFGRYVYTGVLQPSIFGVPLVMACAWMVLVAYLKQVLLRLDAAAWSGALVAAAWMTTIDLLIDPLAANQLGYWRWAERGNYYGIPSSNFVGWFVCSLSIFVLLRRERRQANFWHRLTGVSIILFFTLIALSFQLFIAALIGFGLCAAELLIGRKSSKFQVPGSKSQV